MTSKARCKCGNPLNVKVRFAKKDKDNFMCPECYLDLKIKEALPDETVDET